MGDFIKIHEPCATCAPLSLSLSLVVFEFCALRRNGPTEANLLSPTFEGGIEGGRRQEADEIEGGRESRWESGVVEQR